MRHLPLLAELLSHRNRGEKDMNALGTREGTWISLFPAIVTVSNICSNAYLPAGLRLVFSAQLLLQVAIIGAIHQI